MKNVTLHEVHEWIEDAREILYNEVEETMTPSKEVNVVVTADEVGHYSPDELQAIQKELRAVLKKIVDFDLHFHDSFDCQ